MIASIRRSWCWLSDEPRHRTGLRVLQIAIGLMVMFRVFTEGRFTPYLYGPWGLGRGSTIPLLGPLGMILDLAFRTDAGVYAMLAVLALGALGLIYGVRTRLAVFLTLVPFFMMEQRLPELGDGGDNVTRLVLVYMLFAIGAQDKPVRGGLAVWLHNIAVMAIIAQLFVVYETSGMMKIMGEKWHGGTAMYYISQVEWFGHPITREIFKNPIATTLGSFLPIVFLVFFPLAVFTRLKMGWIAFGVLFHTTIAFAMGLVTFATVMIGLELFLITDSEYERARSRLASAFSRLSGVLAAHLRPRQVQSPVALLYIDGYCPFCRAAGRRLARLDWRHALDIRSFRHDSSYEDFGITSSALERRMHLVDLHSGATHSGFAAVRALARALPPLAPLRPVLTLVGAAGLGDYLYDALAKTRKIIPDPTACDESCRAAFVREQEG